VIKRGWALLLSFPGERDERNDVREEEEKEAGVPTTLVSVRPR